MTALLVSGDTERVKTDNFYTNLPSAIRAAIKRHQNRHRSDHPLAPPKPEFSLAVQNGQLLSTVYLALLFSTGMPVMIWLATLSLFLQILSDRFMLLKGVCQKPHRVGDKGTRWVLDILLFAALAHAFIGICMIGYREVPTWDLGWQDSRAPVTAQAKTASADCKDTHETSVFLDTRDWHYIDQATIWPLAIACGILFIRFSTRVFLLLRRTFYKPAKAHLQGNPPLDNVLSGKVKCSREDSQCYAGEIRQQSQDSQVQNKSKYQLRGERSFFMTSNNKYNWLTDTVKCEDFETQEWYHKMFFEDSVGNP